MPFAEVDKDYGACITSQIAGCGRKLDALISLIRKRVGEGPMTKKLNAFAQSAVGLAEQRNRIIHDPIVRLEGEAHPRRVEITARKVLVVRTDPQPEGDVLKVAQAIHLLNDRFQALMGEMEAELERIATASPETPEPA